MGGHREMWREVSYTNQKERNSKKRKEDESLASGESAAIQSASANHNGINPTTSF